MARTLSVEELIPDQILGIVGRGTYGTARASDRIYIRRLSISVLVILVFMSETANRNFPAGLESIKTLYEMNR